MNNYAAVLSKDKFQDSIIVHQVVSIFHPEQAVSDVSQALPVSRVLDILLYRCRKLRHTLTCLQSVTVVSRCAGQIAL